MMRFSPRSRPEALLMAASLVCVAMGWLQCGGTEDLTPKVEPRPYDVIGNEDCAVFPDLFLKFRSIPVGAGSHTLRLEASTYGDQPDSSYRSRFVCALLSAGADTSARQDWFFTLNGIGDEKTVTFASSGTVYLGYIGTVPLGNHGQSVVSLDAQEFQILAEAHSVVAADLSERFVEVEYDSSGAGDYEITLDRSDFSPRSGLVAPLVVLYFPEAVESARDHLITSLNGAGDKVTVHLEPDSRIYAGFVDDLGIDNSGGADVTVVFRGAP
jgi:hypothetical protein